MPKKKNPISIPESLLQQINEYTTGGFIMHFKNSAGDISTVERYDGSVDAIGLRKYAQVWGNVSDNATENEIAASIFESMGIDPEDLDDPDFQD
jgi:hypothetical protein